MDDFVHSYDNLLEPQQSNKAFKAAHHKRRFNSTKFISRITDELGFLNEPQVETKSTICRVLGEKRDIMNGTLIFQPELKNKVTATEIFVRKVLSTVARIFDPVDLSAPFVFTL